MSKYETAEGVDISFIVCTFNGRLRLPSVLDKLATQAPGSEIIVVDNASNDGTGDWATEYWQIHGSPAISFRVVRESRPGLLWARTTGVLESRGEFIVFVDDDNVVTCNVHAAVVPLFRANPSIGAIGGLGTATFDGVEPPWFRKYRACYACGPQADFDGVVHPRVGLYGALLSVRGAVAREIYGRGGFRLTGRVGSLQMAGDDTELCRKIAGIGLQLYYLHTLTFNHHMSDGRMTKDRLAEMFIGFGVSWIMLTRHYPTRSPLATKLRLVALVVKCSLKCLFADGLTRRLSRAYLMGMMQGVRLAGAEP